MGGRPTPPAKNHVRRETRSSSSRRWGPAPPRRLRGAVGEGEGKVRGDGGEVGIGAGVEGSGLACVLEGWGGEAGVGFLVWGEVMLNRGWGILGLFWDCGEAVGGLVGGFWIGRGCVIFCCGRLGCRSGFFGFAKAWEAE